MSSHTQVLWGTNINTNDLQHQLKEFLLTFTSEEEGLGDDQFNREPFYITKLKEMAETEEYILDVDCHHLYEFRRSLYKQLEDYPADVIPIFDLVALQVFKDQVSYGNGNMGGDLQGSNLQEMEQNEQIIQVRPFNMRANYQIRDLDPRHIDKLITLKGIVIRASDTVPEMKEACFQCQVCKKEEYKYVERGRISQPESCEHCKSRNCYTIIHNYCMFSDK
jgi:DNA replication licensing factor MCM4